MAGRKRVTHKIRQLLRECDARFTSWDASTSFDISALVDHLSRQRDRPIQLVPIVFGAPQPSGLWLALQAIDVVIYAADTSRTHQEHIIAHELAHIVCGHTGSASVDDRGARLIFPDLDPNLVRDMLGRSECNDDHELEAEIMASVILRRMNPPPSEPRRVHVPGTGDVLDRLERSFSINGGSAE